MKVLAFDYGASSGRGILGKFDGEKLYLEELHRFASDPVMVGDSLHWDILRLFHEMKQGILKCTKDGQGDISSIGIDTWGVDFGLLGPKGELLGNPYHYRDIRTDGMIEAATKIVPKRELYRHTGIQFQKFNTLYQLLAMKLNQDVILEKAETLLLIPDLLNYFLTGEKASEWTIASTTQMCDANSRTWAKELLNKLGIPTGMLTEIIQPGTQLGTLRNSITEELGIGKVPVIAVAEHDTGSAVVSVPAAEDKYAYISSGTWSLLGVESENPVISDRTRDLNYTNEGGINNTVRFLKNIMGLWIYQECKRAWDKAGDSMSFDALEAAAAEAKPFAALIDPEDEMFFAPGRMPQKIQEYCVKTSQKPPESRGEIVRCIMESLALKYRSAVEELESILGYGLPVIHIVGGGCKNTMLCQFTADATARQVLAGPIEATAIGNIMSQFISLGRIANLKEARAVIRNSFPISEYTPVNRASWDEAYNTFHKLTNKK